MRLLLNVPGRSRRLGRAATAGLQEHTGEVLASSDDAHELISTGAMDLTSANLSMGGYTGVVDPTATGIRFTNVPIEQGGAVSFAQLRFVAGAGNSKACLLRVWAQAHDNAVTFTTTAADITDRAKTTAFVDWDVPVWELDFDNADTRSPDLAALVQEVVNRAGWVSGNSIVFLIETSPAIVDTEFPRRRPRAFDSTDPGVTRFSINTTEGQPAPDPTPTGAFSDGYEGGEMYGLVGNSTFDPANPTLKDGTAITPGSDLHKFWHAATYAHLNSNATSGDARYVNLALYLGYTNTYESSRWGQLIGTNLLLLFRLTGDLRLLDRLVNGWNQAKQHSVIPWNGHDCVAFDGNASYMSCPVASGDPWSPHRKFLNYETGFSYGTDFQYQNTNKHACIMTEAAWALHVNRGKISPAGYDYDHEADYWGDRVEQFVKTWSTDPDPHAPTTGQTWHTNYRGDEYMRSSRRRTPAGEFPIVYRNGGHVGVQAGPHHHYLGLLAKHSSLDLPDGDAALAWTRDFMQNVRDNGFVACSGPYGDNFLVRGRITNPGTSTVPHGATYTKYTIPVFVQMWLAGGYREQMTRADLRKVALAFAEMCKADGTTFPNVLAGTSPRCGLEGATTGGQDAAAHAWSGFSGLLVFEDRSATTRLTDVANLVQTNNAGGWVTPWAGILPTFLFVREALDAVGDTG